MRRFATAALTLALGLSPGVVCAQSDAPAAASASTAIDGTALGVSLSRIAQRLALDSEARSVGTSPLKLEFHVDVYGNAPQLRFFSGQDLVYGGVPFSAPTHRDMLMHVTPQAFRSPRVDFLSMITGVAMYGAKRVQQWEYDRDLAAYKKRVEAGQNVPPPRPPQ